MSMRRATLACLSPMLATLGMAHAAMAQDMATPMATSCEALAQSAMPDAVSLSAQAVAQDAFHVPAEAHGGPSAGMNITGAFPSDSNPAFCRIQARLKPSAQSDIRVEVWLPIKGWNGKLIGVGNLGWGGNLPYANMLAGLQRGYAVAGNDTGHDSNGPDGEGGKFLLGKPEVLIDYAWRANHLMTLAAKALAKSAYGSAPRRAYWIGCSLGGLQGLIEARKFPDDYDGVVAGAPPNPLASFNAAQLWPNWLIARDRRRGLSADNLVTLHHAVLSACAKQVGTLYGYVEDPAHCHFDPASIQCRPAQTRDCLSARQVALVRWTYRGPVNPRSGKVIFPGPAKGSELEWTPFTNGGEFGNAADLFRYAGLQNAAWRANALDWRKDVPAVVKRLAPLLQVDADFTEFAARGGRLLLYVGGNDYHNPAELANYLGRIHAKLGAKADHYARMFVIPGMGHCAGSAGCDAWDKVEAIDAWVDRKAGRQPREVAKLDAAGAVIRRQPLCYYPEVPTYRGAGDPALAASYQCATAQN
jgi:feruloyl esterase